LLIDRTLSSCTETDEGCVPPGPELACVPVFLSLAGKRVVLSGGSNATLWKAELCHAAGAELEIFGPAPCPGLVRLAKNSAAVTVVLRDVMPHDFHGAALAIAEAESSAQAETFRAFAQAAGVPVNIIDKPRFSDLQFGAIVDRSPLVIGISTSGSAPVLAQAVRGRLEALLPRELKSWAQKAKAWRDTLSRFEASPGMRRHYWALFSRKALAGMHPPQDRDLAAFLAEAEDNAPPEGSVALVGAGPGDPDLLTLKALRALQSADAVLYDDLVSPSIVDMSRREAEKIYVGKRGHKFSCRQDHILELMVSLASQGKRVVRLKGGDPMIFGRASEEIAALRAKGIPAEVVPGVTAALGAAARLKLSLTERTIARRVQFITAHAHDGKLPEDIDWPALCDQRASTVVYMGVKTLGPLASRLLSHGLDSATPAIVVERATCPDERCIVGTIGTIAAKVSATRPSGPCVILIGEAFADALHLPRTEVKLETRPRAMAN